MFASVVQETHWTLATIGSLSWAQVSGILAGMNRLHAKNTGAPTREVSDQQVERTERMMKAFKAEHGRPPTAKELLGLDRHEKSMKQEKKHG